ncbi:unnamed protein product, partial [marine sediment metagenome]
SGSTSAIYNESDTDHQYDRKVYHCVYVFS